MHFEPNLWFSRSTQAVVRCDHRPDIWFGAVRSDGWDVCVCRGGLGCQLSGRSGSQETTLLLPLLDMVAQTLETFRVRGCAACGRAGCLKTIYTLYQHCARHSCSPVRRS